MKLPSKPILITIILVIISPIFGVILADLVGYHEPLDVAAEKLGLQDISENINWTPFFDYSVPGLNPIVGYIISGFIGIAVIISIGYTLSKITGERRH